MGDGTFEMGTAVSIEPYCHPGNIRGRRAKKGGATECAVPSNMGAGWLVRRRARPEMGMLVEHVTGAVEIPLPAYLVGFRDPFL